MMTKEGSTKIVNVMTIGARVLVLWHGQNENFFLLFLSTLGQIKYILMITKERSTKILKFHDPRGWVSYAKVLPYKLLHCLLLYQYTAH